ncbi:unnamed protein product [Didymodactylos carnosus]|uniref:Endonuclease/exonuclease/phosphatase domain-containing protein n=1 Tax=Didymodactylos carnosus TaxID=1234261 RepID=A0A8S2F0B7_9BILA|nr:unnamed protein product [Didymodactylos carnosus]CAF4092485.1 unnamed protein product [Didymodactylos carnosus]
MLTEVCSDIIDIPSRNVKSKNNCGTLIKGNRQQSNSKLKAKVDNYKNLRVVVGVRVVITENMCEVNRLVKGASDTIVEIIMYPVTSVVQTIRVKFDNPDCGLQHQANCKLLLHNIEGLNGHYMEMKNHSWLDKCDIVYLTETWLRTGKNAPEIDSHIYILGISLDTMPLCDVECICVKTTINGESCLILTIYKSPTSSSVKFLQNFAKIMAEVIKENCSSIIVGDINESLKEPDQPIRTYFIKNGYKSLISGATTKENTSINCIFVKFRTSVQHRITIIPACYSYHTAFMLELFKENADLSIGKPVTPTEEIQTPVHYSEEDKARTRKRKITDHDNSTAKKDKNTETLEEKQKSNS